MVIYPELFSIKPNTEASQGFKNLFKTASEMAARKTLTLLKGNYLFQSKNATLKRINISNTIGESEYADSDMKNLRHIALYLEDIADMEIDCGGSTFVIDGRMTNIVMKNCRNVTLKNLNIDTVLPDVHKFTVTKASPFYVTFKLDGVSKYVEENGEYYFYGTDYKTGFREFVNSGWWMATARPSNYSHILRNGEHIFAGSSALREISERVFSVRYISPKNYEVGQEFYFYHAIRDEVGILLDSCKNIKLENVSQSFNIALALVAQNTVTVTLENLDFSPRKDSQIPFCSFADFLQFSMCRGNIAVKECNFDSAGDDVCNVHGFHFKITKVGNGRLTVRFCHPQSYGFECLREGDTIAFIDPETLLEVGRSRILKATLRDEYYYDLEIASREIPIGVGGVIEDISACPNFTFTGNTMNRIVTRGVLVTTRGRVLIENNKFLNMGHSGVLVSDDAHSWYESGCVKNVTISRNAFVNCDMDNILIKPENARYSGAVHENIVIENNLFMLNDTHAVNASCVNGLTVKNNVFKGTAKDGTIIKVKNVRNIQSDVHN